MYKEALKYLCSVSVKKNLSLLKTLIQVNIDYLMEDIGKKHDQNKRHLFINT
jgi:hypothetical protein